MPSSIAHGLAAVALGTALYPTARTRVYAAAAVGAVLPDIDAIGRPFGLGDVDWLGGHRALTHSLPFAALLAAVAVALVCRGSDWNGRRSRAWAFFVIAFALHGALDAFTTYGSGVEFLAPFSVERFKAAWQPFDGILLEIVGIWLPALAVVIGVRVGTSGRNPSLDSGAGPSIGTLQKSVITDSRGSAPQHSRLRAQRATWLLRKTQRQ